MVAPDQDAVGANTTEEPVGPPSFKGAKPYFHHPGCVTGTSQGHSDILFLVYLGGCFVPMPPSWPKHYFTVFTRTIHL